MMDLSDRQAIISAVRSYRVGAPMIIEDIRVAAAVDGHSLRHVSSLEIVEVLQDICDSRPCQPQYHMRTSWIRRA